MSPGTHAKDTSLLHRRRTLDGSRRCPEDLLHTFSLKSLVQAKVVDSSAGNEKFKADKRQFAGLLMAFSVCASFFPLGGLAGVMNTDGFDGERLVFPYLIARLSILLTAIAGATTAYLALVHDWGNKLLTLFLLGWVQTAWIPYITDMINVGRMARTGTAFIPNRYSPGRDEVGFVGAIGVLGILTFGFCFIGSLVFMSFSLYACQVGKPCDRSASYYRHSLLLLSVIVTLAGMAQVMLGSFIVSNFGTGPLPEPIGVAMFIVFFPEISIFVGIVYILNGLHGCFRAIGTRKVAVNDNSYQFGMWFQCACTLVLMIFVQTSYGDEGMLAVAAPSLAALTYGASVLPAYMEYKARTIPEVIPDNYYGLESIHEREEESIREEDDDDETVDEASYVC